MERASRSELVSTVASQKEKLEKYESKLKDLVHAYRGLLKEKEALEATVSVLSASQSESSTTEQTSDTLKEQTPTTTTTNEPGGQGERVKVLTASVATLSQEKSRLEAVYIAEKKQLKQDNEELQKTLDSEREARNGDITELTSQIQDMKGRIRIQQQEREKEQTDHVVMLRELQKLLAEERTTKEKLEFEFDELKFTLKEVESELNLCCDAQERLVSAHAETEEVKKVLRLTKEKAERAEVPPPIIAELRREIQHLKAEHKSQLLKEQSRANDADDRSRRSANQDEARASELEAKISELSEVIGNYERVRTQDQQSIQRLKERLNQLDAENSALTEAMSSRGDYVDAGMSVDEMVSRVTALVEMLNVANSGSEAPVNIADLLGASAGGESAECKRYREELEGVREEFECYKLRAQSVLKNRNSKDSNANKEVDTLKQQIFDLKDKLRTSYTNSDDLKERHDKKLEESRQNLLSVQESHKQEITRLGAEHRQQTSDLEQELRKQRARTVTLLAEKDRDLEQMRRLSSVPHFDTEAWLERNAGASEEVVHPSLARTRSQEEQAVANIMNQSMFTGQHESMLYVHFTEEQARKEQEVNSLRKQKRLLETELRDLQQTSELKEEKLHENVQGLEEEVRKQERDKSRESANLEYLKNVTFRFLTSTDTAAKTRMVNAIATILQFSPKEKSMTHSHKSTWW